MKKIALLLLLVSYTFSFAQEKYKYIIVPKKFEFFKEENKYNTSYITKSFFEKEGFQVFYDTDYFPDELAKNRCLALFVNAIENNSLLNTKINFEIKDCFNKVVYVSNQGESREKELKTAYTLAFRQALSSMSGMLNFKSSQIKKETLPISEADKIVAKDIKVVNKTGVNSNQLFAIPTESGYKIVDSAPKTIMIIHKTSHSDVFIAEKDDFTGVFLKKINGWFFEYYQNNKFISEKVEVKF